MHHGDIGFLKNCNTPKTKRHFFNCLVFMGMSKKMAINYQSCYCLLKAEVDCPTPLEV